MRTLIEGGIAGSRGAVRREKRCHGSPILRVFLILEVRRPDVAMAAGTRVFRASGDVMREGASDSVGEDFVEESRRGATIGGGLDRGEGDVRGEGHGD